MQRCKKLNFDNHLQQKLEFRGAVEPLPFNLGDEGLLHYRALPLLGLPLGELFSLAPLAADCAADGRYEFMLVSTPLNVDGGIASPPNAVAIK